MDKMNETEIETVEIQEGQLEEFQTAIQVLLNVKTINTAAVNKALMDIGKAAKKALRYVMREDAKQRSAIDQLVKTTTVPAVSLMSQQVLSQLPVHSKKTAGIVLGLDDDKVADLIIQYLVCLKGMLGKVEENSYLGFKGTTSTMDYIQFPLTESDKDENKIVDEIADEFLRFYNKLHSDEIVTLEDIDVALINNRVSIAVYDTENEICDIIQGELYEQKYLN